MKKVMMKCGHAANAKDGYGRPSCVICAGINPNASIVDKKTTDLTGRISMCSNCKRTVPSTVDLPFFEYRGDGSPTATQRCKCGYYEVAHQMEGFECKNGGFEPHGAYDTDLHYCGCRGWS